MKKSFLYIIILGLSFLPTFSHATEPYENLMQTNAALYELSGKIMSNNEFIRTLPVTKQLYYAYTKARIDLAVNTFEGIAVVMKIYNESSGCKINIIETVNPYVLASKSKAEFLLRQLKPMAEDAKSSDLNELHQYILSAINEINSGLTTLNNLTFFMDKDWQSKLKDKKS